MLLHGHVTATCSLLRAAKKNFETAEILAKDIASACGTLCYRVAKYRNRVQIIAPVLETFVSGYSNR